MLFLTSAHLEDMLNVTDGMVRSSDEALQQYERNTALQNGVNVSLTVICVPFHAWTTSSVGAIEILSDVEIPAGSFLMRVVLQQRCMMIFRTRRILFYTHQYHQE